jgi:hypothetical protein
MDDSRYNARLESLPLPRCRGHAGRAARIAGLGKLPYTAPVTVKRRPLHAQRNFSVATPSSLDGTFRRGTLSNVRSTRVIHRPEKFQLAHGTDIVSVVARQIMSDRGHPGVEAKVVTAYGAKAGQSAPPGLHRHKRDPLRLRGGTKWRGMGSSGRQRVNEVYSPLAPRWTPVCRSRSTTPCSVPGNGKPSSAATPPPPSPPQCSRRRGRLGLPPLRHIGGARAYTLPVPGAGAFAGSNRYRPTPESGGKPSISSWPPISPPL